MQLPSLSKHWAYAAVAFALGCQPDIGDKCTTNTDCSLTGDRLCDPTPPGGYCTQFNCSAGKCPDEAVCVAFYSKLSNQCTDPVSDQRFERSFCMRKCTSSSDCRASEGYDCLTPPKEVNAVVLENGEAASSQVCMIPIETTAPSNSNGGKPSEPAICGYPPVSSDAGTDAARDGSIAPETGVADGGSSADARLDAAADATADARLDATADARVDR